MKKDAFDYIAEANATASNNFHGDKVPLYHFQGVLTNAIQALQALDKIKKAIFYSRDLVGLPERQDVVMNCNQLPSRIDNENDKRGELILHSIVGKATEVGEQLEQLFNVVFNNVSFDEVNFVEEIGDGQWYDAIGLRAVGVTFDECQRRNIAKLRHRFPNAFTEYDANNRDLFGERKIMEMHTIQRSGCVEVEHRETIYGDGSGHALPPIDGGFVSPMDMPKASATAPQQPSPHMIENTNRAAAKGLHIEVRGPTGCGKGLAVAMIQALIPNAIVLEISADFSQANGRALRGASPFKPPAAITEVEMIPRKQQCRIENWAQFGNVLIGDVVGHPQLGDAKGCRTSTILRLDVKAGICETKNTVYTLGCESSRDPRFQD